jgi:hypothetical protein
MDALDARIREVSSGASANKEKEPEVESKDSLAQTTASSANAES